MGARDEIGVADVAQRPVVGAGNADLGELLGHLSRAGFAPAARRREPLDERSIVAVDAEADDVDRGAEEGDRDLDAAQVGQSGGAGGAARAPLAADLVVVGQRPELDAVRLGARRERFGLERAVGNGGMAVQVGVHDPCGLVAS